LSTLALEGSSGTASRSHQPSRGILVLRYLDLIVLAAALPIFLLIGASMLGYAAIAAAWLLQRVIQYFAERGAIRAIRDGVRRNAMGLMAASTLARLWLVTLTILIVGLAGNREAGLAAALLALALVTVSLGCRGLIHLLEAEEPS
jgi:hypothetical protein